MGSVGIFKEPAINAGGAVVNAGVNFSLVDDDQVRVAIYHDNGPSEDSDFHLIVVC
jgi:hypothetical protein